MEFFVISLLNGISYGLLLFLLSAGLTLIYSMLGVLNFAHTSFYMLGAYFGYSVTGQLGFVPALFLAPLMVGGLGALLERQVLQRVHKLGHVAELLVTFGVSYIILELVQLVWGRSAVDYRIPHYLATPLFTLWGMPFPSYRVFMTVMALFILALLWLLLKRTRIGMVIQAALTHPEMVEALGHNVPRIYVGVFAGGCALAGLAGVLGGNALVTEPAMAASVGAIIFVVVVVGGVGSLEGAFLASLLVGVLQTFAVAVDVSALSAFQAIGLTMKSDAPLYALWQIKVGQLAPILPYLLLVLILIFRPQGLLGIRKP